MRFRIPSSIMQLSQKRSIRAIVDHIIGIHIADHIIGIHIQVAHQLFSMWFTGVKTAARSIAFSSGAKRAMFSSAASRRRANDGILRAKVLVVGSGRMGQIRSSLIYANPRFELCGIVDTNLDAARLLATTYQVLCVMRFISDSMSSLLSDDRLADTAHINV